MKWSVNEHIGKKYTHLTIISKAIQDNPVYIKVTVQCDCGRYDIKYLRKILTSETRTCGKCNLRYKLPPLIGKTDLTDNIKQRLLKKAYQQKKIWAKRRRLEFNLSLEFVKERIIRPCESCGDSGISFTTSFFNGELYTLYHNGLDRIDNSKGYEPNNTAILCLYCNRLKWTSSIKEMIHRNQGLAKLGRKLLAEGKK